MEVQEKSDQIWKYKRYALVIEYHNRPGLVAPFMILNTCLVIHDIYLQDTLQKNGTTN